MRYYDPSQEHAHTDGYHAVTVRRWANSDDAWWIDGEPHDRGDGWRTMPVCDRCKRPYRYATIVRRGSQQLDLGRTCARRLTEGLDDPEAPEGPDTDDDPDAPDDTPDTTVRAARVEPAPRPELPAPASAEELCDAWIAFAAAFAPTGQLGERTAAYYGRVILVGPVVRGDAPRGRYAFQIGIDDPIGPWSSLLQATRAAFAHLHQTDYLDATLSAERGYRLLRDKRKATK